MLEVRMKLKDELPLNCRDCDYEAFVGGKEHASRRECLFTDETIDEFEECRGNKCPLKNDGIFVSDLKKEDWKLIIDAMAESSVCRKGEAEDLKSVMSNETYNKNLADAERLVFLINVLKGTQEYNEGETINDKR